MKTLIYKISFKYNSETNLYERYVNKKIQNDWIKNEIRTTKNIIVTFANNYTTDEDNVVRHSGWTIRSTLICINMTS